MPAPPEVVTALWLLPGGVAAEYLGEKVRQLAAQYAAPLFTPHLTLGLGDASLLERINPEPFELAVVGVEAAPEFTKTLFVRCALAPELAALRDSLGLSAAGYDPHLSLLYCDLPLAEKRRLAATVDFPFPRLRFTAAAAIQCTLPVAGAADVAGWKTLATKTFPGSPRH